MKTHKGQYKSLQVQHLVHGLQSTLYREIAPIRCRCNQLRNYHYIFKQLIPAIFICNRIITELSIDSLEKGFLEIYRNPFSIIELLLWQ